jgi:hypothetical protein
MADHGLHDDFELTGNFWLPTKPDERVSGTLRCDAGRVELALVGGFSDLADGGIDQVDHILGSTNEGPCTLRVAWRSQKTWTMFTDHDEQSDRETWRALHLYLGAALTEADDDPVFLRVEFSFDQLESWLARPAFEQTHDQGVWVAKHEHPDVVALGLTGARLTIGRSFRGGGDQFRTLEWSLDASLGLIPETMQSFSWFMDRLTELRGLLGLLIGEPTIPTRIEARTAERNVAVFFSVTGTPRKERLHPAEMAFPRPDLGDRLEAIFKEWFDRQEALRTVTALLFGALYATDMTNEFRFLALTQALETLHRRRMPGLYIDEKDYKPIHDALVAAIPDGTAPDLRQSLKTRISFGNELAQRRRFKELRGSLGEPSSSVVTPEFLEQAVEMRNFLTHYPSGQPPMSPLELTLATYRLRTLLSLLLLAEVGITGSEALVGLNRTRWVRGFVTGAT